MGDLMGKEELAQGSSNGLRTIHDLRDLQFTEMFIMVEPTLNNENPTQEYIGTNNL